LVKKRKITGFYNTNKKTKQLSSHLSAFEHRVFCSESRQEMEEFFRRAVEKYKEILEEVRRAALADEETVKKVDEVRKNGCCVGCHSENVESRSNIDNKRSNNKVSLPEKSISTVSDEEQKNKEQQLVIISQVNQPKEKEENNDNVVAKAKCDKPLENNDDFSNQNVDKDALIIQLKKEIAELKKNLNSDEKKSLLVQKETKLAELESRQRKGSEGLSNDKNNGLSLPIKIAIGSGIVLVLTVLLVGIVKSLKRIKIRK
jgi:hypothetical protein